jgi:para-nitrobenzyl esterase
MHEHTVRATVGTGIVEGFTRDGVHRWRSIPYAKPPIGPLRFRAPRPAEPWRGVRYCHGFSNCAPQQRKYTITGLGRYQPMGEDCLTLNVVAPEIPPGADQDRPPLPVMVFVHGGAYMLGSSATVLYDGAALARRGCVYVSVNYRLGALGSLDLSSLSTPDITIESNLFLRDLVMALGWVRDNIAVFGGDPDNVTIFGESAGGQAVATLLAIPAAKGLFQQAISESPAAGMVRSQDIAMQFAQRFADIIGPRRHDAASALMQASPDRLVDALDALIADTGHDALGAFPVGPAYGDDYLPLDPVEAMASGTAHRVPLVIGNNAEEAKLFTRVLKLLPTSEPLIEALLAGAGQDARDRITAAYPGYPGSAACVRLCGDFAFNSAAWQMADAHSRYAPTYLYRYDYAPRTLNWSGLGATHGTELLAVFDVYNGKFGSLLTAAGDRSSALRVSRDLQSRWRSFSRTGVPGDGWPAYEPAERAVMVFDRRSRVEFDPDLDRRTAWQGFSLTGGSAT